MKVGDVVRLKSGGPDMTVSSVEAPSRWGYSVPMVWCCYFDGKWKERETHFPEPLLQIVDATRGER